MSKKYVIADNGHWSLGLELDEHGLHIGTKAHYNNNHFSGLYLTEEEQDELIFRLVQYRRRSKLKTGRDTLKNYTVKEGVNIAESDTGTEAARM